MKKREWIITAVVVIVVLVILGLLALFYSCEKTEVCMKDRCFVVKVARSEIERSIGLMYEKEMANDEGMLFIFEGYGERGFWMKDTLIPLDIIWIKDNEIVHIYENAQPCAEKCPSIRPNVSANYVLELNTGLTSEMNLEIGDIVEIKI